MFWRPAHAWAGCTDLGALGRLLTLNSGLRVSDTTLRVKVPLLLPGQTGVVFAGVDDRGEDNFVVLEE